MPVRGGLYREPKLRFRRTPMTLVDDLIPHMRRVLVAERDLRDLNLLWQMIEASSAISCPEEAASILPMLTRTRVRFSALQTRLVQQLGAESLAELHDELASTAQCTIDILVRNLFERTADVGFLATDDVLRAFCEAPASERERDRAALVRRLVEYRTKYTVYDDIVLTGRDGEVLARLDDAGGLARSTDPLVAGALAATGHVESFAPSDLGRDGRPVLLYAHRVTDATGRTLGVLLLRFRHVDELALIFGEVLAGKPQTALLLLDAQDRVIASSDEAHVPLGAKLQTGSGGELALTVFAGREYLSVTRATPGYQGYGGPRGWRAHAMVSLLTAFRSADDGAPAPAEPVSLAHDELARIQREVDAINGDLRRVVWNGRLVAGVQAGAQARLKAVLQQVHEAGTRTRDRVAAAIGALHRTGFDRAGHQAQAMARLAADILDRNLYERANDCRWWALSPVLQRVLAAPAGGEGDRAGRDELNAVLAHVNGLYTVYSRLVVFDAEGRIRGVSLDDPMQTLLGQRIDDALLGAVVALPDSQRYAVTPFAGSPLSGGVPTYVYAAAVRAADDRRVLGGIAVVFDAAREFRAMLDDVLAGRAGAAAFVDGEGRVLASTREDWPVGQRLPIDASTGLAQHGGQQYAVARVRGGGYREFKRGDGYDNGVQAVVALHLGPVERRRTAQHEMALSAWPPADRNRMREFALFHVGAGRFALPAAEVLEARPKDGLVRAPLGGAGVLGLLEVPDGRGACVIPVLCARHVLGEPGQPRTLDGVVLVLSGPGPARRPQLGLMVDQVNTVLDIGVEHLQAPPAGLRGHAPTLQGLLTLSVERPDQPASETLVQWVDAGALRALAEPLAA